MTKHPVAQPEAHLPTPARPNNSRKLSVNRPGDRWEKEADRTADTVMKGARVSGVAAFSFADIPVGKVQRQDTKETKAPAKKSDAEKYKKGLTKAGEAALKTEAGKKLLEKIENDKLVKGGKQFFESTPGKIVAGALVAGGVTGLIVAKQPLPFKLPNIPITDHMKIGIDIQGPLNRPTSGMLTFTYSESGGKSKGKSKEDFARETAELRRSLEMFRQKPKYIPPAGSLPLAPYRDLLEPKKEDKKKKKVEEKGVVQRKEATAVPDMDVPQSVPDSLNGPGQPLDKSIRQTMEAQFGYDFGQVRIHTDRQADESARAINSVAYTVGHDIAFTGGKYSPTSPDGKRLLAHELTHVVQQTGHDNVLAKMIQRQVVTPAKTPDASSTSSAKLPSATELTTRIARCIGIWETNRGKDNPAPKESSLDTVAGVHASMATIEQATMPYAITALKKHKELRNKAVPPLTMKELNAVEARCKAVVTLLKSVDRASSKGDTPDDFIKNNTAPILATGLSNDDIKQMFKAVSLKSTLDKARTDAETEGKAAKLEAAKNKKNTKQQAAAERTSKQKSLKKSIKAIPAADRLGLGEGSLKAYARKPHSWGENRAGWQRKAVSLMPDNVGSRIEKVATSDNGTALATPVIKDRVDTQLAKTPVPSLEEIVKTVAQRNNPGEKGYGEHVWKIYKRLYPEKSSEESK